MQQRVPPQSVDAEEAVLGGILLDNRLLETVVETLRPEDYYREAHRRIYAAILDLEDRGEPVDVITLAEHLKARGELEGVGGAASLVELVERSGTPANVGHYARIVKDKAVMRGLVEAANDISTRGYQGAGDVDQLIDDAERAIFQISERRTKTAFARVGDLLTPAIETIESLYRRQELVTGVPTGFADLDRITAGLQPSDLIIIAGRPAMGKSAFATNLGQYAATHDGKAVALFSLEMSKEQLVVRMLCGEARVDGTKVRSGHLTDRDFQRLAAAASSLDRIPFYIDDTPGVTVMEVRAKCRRLLRDSEHPLGLVIIDYLQLMRAHRDVDNREQEISAISRSLKGLAKEMHIPVIALSQLNRQVEQRGDKRPGLADLRESGAIEQDADVIMFVYRDEVYNKVSAEEGTAEIIVGKQRNGPTGTVKLAFRKELTRFENLSARSDDDEVPIGGSLASELDAI